MPTAIEAGRRSRCGGRRPAEFHGRSAEGCGWVDGVRRGDLVTVAMQGDFGKPRPALVIQSDQFDAHATVTVLLVTSAVIAAPLFRLTIDPTPRAVQFC
ncbi:MAG: type II toxin-antitoxin system PemK/MazF family toxin [Alphaproteobacteria bacterium]|nr:type II toxin-antitoxin system PemK/MazF family toxin [Alphaproteobacteria bacterium]